jgi:hypothetical protein
VVYQLILGSRVVLGIKMALEEVFLPMCCWEINSLLYAAGSMSGVWGFVCAVGICDKKKNMSE